MPQSNHPAGEPARDLPTDPPTGPANNLPMDNAPSARTLLRSTVVAALIATALLFAVVLPAEYGYDVLGVGRVIGLTHMGEIKMELAREASADAGEGVAVGSDRAGNAALYNAASASGEDAPQWRDSVTVALAPNAGIELKLTMQKGQQAMYQWSVDSAEVSYNAHGEPPNAPRGFAHSYGRGTSPGMQGDLVAAFDGVHGWHWRNRSDGVVHLTLKTRGDYTDLREIK